MRVLEIKNITKKNIPLHYRNEFSGMAVMELPPDKREEKPLEFILERSATGDLHIKVHLLESIDYPLLPALRHLREHIFDMERRGKLQ
jgi:hypothetical protein